MIVKLPRVCLNCQSLATLVFSVDHEFCLYFWSTTNAVTIHTILACVNVCSLILSKWVVLKLTIIIILKKSVIGQGSRRSSWDLLSSAARRSRSSIVSLTKSRRKNSSQEEGEKEKLMAAEREREAVEEQVEYRLRSRDAGTGTVGSEPEEKESVTVQAFSVSCS